MFLPKEHDRPWLSVSSSAVLHTVLILVAILLTRHENEVMQDQEEEQRVEDAQRREHIVRFFLPPPPPPKPVTPPPPPPPQPPRPQPKVQAPPPTPLPVAPPPEVEQRKPEPDPNAPPEEKRSVGTAEPDDKDKGAKAPNDAARSGAPPADIAMNAMESEAKRIFGRKKEGPPAGAGPRDVRPLQTWLPDRPDKCVPKPVAPAESAGPPQMGVAVGRIFRGDNGRPLAGAHLVMLGTPYTSFTDEDGEYTFRFDLSLVDNCRTQYVRVSAQGYESRLLVLVVGPRTRSEDVTLRRRR